ncbi:dihydrofolate reductase family protein [Nocardioides sp. cx-173]|uniref:dihydrofolate reductase family protein n=1 Tax=Nocardioides sp. cx-173 TaxID=2898796 RepID=UPI001E555FBF|nr:dihydrofolate reductase family protein [Nocardioides sp. cx-173]MCD4524676.1 dihydrofolate reductase family protein [Nocardioides sp. cx-173]UGB43186.1 dihydrofolate reductase family protein [Nocardioides sp. cx-173]
MRKVVMYELMSLDGVAEEPSDWMFEVDDDVFANMRRVIAAQDDVLLGRGTYDYWSGYWPTSDVQPFADFINTTPKHVVTSTAPATSWTNTVLVHEPAADYVARLKEGEGGDIGIHGSLTLATTLLDADLVDVLELVVVPTLAGSGRRLFGDRAEPGRLRLDTVAASATGAVFLRYLRG